LFFCVFTGFLVKFCGADHESRSLSLTQIAVHSKTARAIHDTRIRHRLSGTNSRVADI
jgi:hypothetical protein